MSKYQEELEKIQKHLLVIKNYEIRAKSRFLIRVLESKNISIGCDKAALQRSTFYDRMTTLRENNYNLHTLLGKSPRPHNSPRKTSQAVEKEVLAIREQRASVEKPQMDFQTAWNRQLEAFYECLFDKKGVIQYTQRGFRKPPTSIKSFA